MDTLTAIILAAGRSRRLGCDKALLPLAGRRLVELVLGAFECPGVARRVVVANEENAAELSSLLAGRAQVVVNRLPGAEMLDSLLVGLGAAGDGAVLVHPVDHFAVQRAVVEMLLAAWQQAPNDIHQPEVSGHGAHPVLLPAAVAAELRCWRGQGGLRAFLRERAGRVARHAWADPRLGWDVDDEEGYHRAVGSLGC